MAAGLSERGALRRSPSCRDRLPRCKAHRTHTSDDTTHTAVGPGFAFLVNMHTNAWRRVPLLPPEPRTVPRPLPCAFQGAQNSDVNGRVRVGAAQKRCCESHLPKHPPQLVAIASDSKTELCAIVIILLLLDPARDRSSALCDICACAVARRLALFVCSGCSASARRAYAAASGQRA